LDGGAVSAAVKAPDDMPGIAIQLGISILGNLMLGTSLLGISYMPGIQPASSVSTQAPLDPIGVLFLISSVSLSGSLSLCVCL
jgi:hypothetical protein